MAVRMVDAPVAGAAGRLTGVPRPLTGRSR